MDIFNNLGIDPIKFLLQVFIWFLIFCIPAIMATRKVIAFRVAPEVSLWLLFIWLVPLFGPYVTLYLVKAPNKQNA